EEINRHIYYDTDGIREQQNDTVRLCEHCPGYQITSSRGTYSTGKSRVIEAVAIQHSAGKTCQEEARGYYEERKREREGLDVVYLQDKPQDRYYQFSADGEIEILD